MESDGAVGAGLGGDLDGRAGLGAGAMSEGERVDEVKAQVKVTVVSPFGVANNLIFLFGSEREVSAGFCMVAKEWGIDVQLRAFPRTLPPPS